MNEENKSKVARLLAHISAEQEAAERGLHGLAQGTAEHAFITAKMERIGLLGSELSALVGEHEGARLLINALEAAPQAEQRGKP